MFTEQGREADILNLHTEASRPDLCTVSVPVSLLQQKLYYRGKKGDLKPASPFSA